MNSTNFFTASCHCMQVTHHMVLADTDSRPTIALAPNDNIIVLIHFFRGKLSTAFAQCVHDWCFVFIHCRRQWAQFAQCAMRFRINLVVDANLKCQMWIEKKKYHLLRTNGAHGARHLSENEWNTSMSCVHCLDAKERYCVSHNCTYALFCALHRRSEYKPICVWWRRCNTCASRSHFCPPNFRQCSI